MSPYLSSFLNCSQVASENEMFKEKRVRGILSFGLVTAVFCFIYFLDEISTSQTNQTWFCRNSFGLFTLPCDMLLSVNRFAIRLPSGQFIIYTDMGMSEQWTHVVLNYFGPNNGQRIQVYFDGVETARDATKVSKTFSGGDGKVVLGRQKTDSDEGYASADMDELLFFNTKLSNAQVGKIINMT